MWLFYFLKLFSVNSKSAPQKTNRKKTCCNQWQILFHKHPMSMQKKLMSFLSLINQSECCLTTFFFILKNISLQNNQCVKSKQEECHCASVKYPLNIIHSQYIELMVGGVPYKCQWEG